MENKRKYLFITVIALFIVSFYTINLRFDPFYRVNGINNDNRMIIEKYLSKEEQKYLVENRIPLYHFMKYIKYDDFYLPGCRRSYRSRYRHQWLFQQLRTEMR